jgi:hypothetical protein
VRWHIKLQYKFSRKCRARATCQAFLDAGRKNRIYMRMPPGFAYSVIGFLNPHPLKQRYIANVCVVYSSFLHKHVGYWVAWRAAETSTGSSNHEWGDKNKATRTVDSFLLGAFANLRKVTTSFVMCVRPSVCVHGTSRLLLDGFSWNVIFEDFSKIYLENQVLIKIWQE